MNDGGVCRTAPATPGLLMIGVRGFSGIHQNLVYIKNENLVYISKGFSLI